MWLCGVECGGGERTLECARASTLDARMLGHLHARSMASEISCLNVHAQTTIQMQAHAHAFGRAHTRASSTRAGWCVQVGGACVTRTAPHSYVGPIACTTGCRRLCKLLQASSLEHARARTRARMCAPVNDRALVHLEKNRQIVLALFTQAKQCAGVCARTRTLKTAARPTNMLVSSCGYSLMHAH